MNEIHEYYHTFIRQELYNQQQLEFLINIILPHKMGMSGWEEKLKKEADVVGISPITLYYALRMLIELMKENVIPYNEEILNRIKDELHNTRAHLRNFAKLCNNSDNIFIEILTYIGKQSV